MSAHTPGPWKLYDDSNDGKTNSIEIVAIGKTVARIYHSVPSEDLPNARLIAAAPDLLAELKAHQLMIGYLVGALGIEPYETFIEVSHGDKSIAQVSVGEVFDRAAAVISKATGGAE